MRNLRNRVESLESQLTENQQKREIEKQIISEIQKFTAEKLPYSYSSLKQFIDPETMNVHYNKHYKGYLDKLNAALGSKEYPDLSLEEIVSTIEKFNETIRNNAGGALNHQMFWKMLSPKPTTPKGYILKKIKQSFGTYNEFKKKFETVAKSRFGSGWVWLVLTKRGTLKVMTTPNQDNPMMDVVKNGGHPLLGLDLWEHAYYLKYRNKRDEYIKNFWKVVNWDFVEEELQKVSSKRVKESQFAKQTLSESTIPEYCSKQEKAFYIRLLNNNKPLLKAYDNKIKKILKDVFKSKHYERNEYAPNTSEGVYDLEKKGRSIINLLNTNFLAFCPFVKDINLVLQNSGLQPIDFTNKSPEEQLAEMERMLDFIEQKKFRIFDTESKTFKKLFQILSGTSSKGSKTEDVVEKKFNEKFGKENVIRTGELGNKEDMMGTDMKVVIDGRKFTAQIKPASSVVEEDNLIKIEDAGNVGRYRTDWMVFVKPNQEIIIFDNNKTQIEQGQYFFPKDALLFQF